MTGYVRRTTRLERPLASRLGRLDIELTERCDNDCIHCCINVPAGDREARAREMTTAQVQRILDEAAALGCLQVRYTGGEPLLRPDFEELYLYARRLGIKVLVFTNARRITPELADLLARVPPLVTAEVTVYGMHAESYEAVTRVPGSYAQSRRGVELLLDRGVPFVVKGALLPPNRGEVEEFEVWAATIPWMDRPPSYSMTFNLRRGETTSGVAGGRAGLLVARLGRLRLALERLARGTLRGAYRHVTRTGVTARVWSHVTPAASRLRIVRFGAGPLAEDRLYAGLRPIGRYDRRQRRWSIDPPYRLLVDEAEIPAIDPA